MSLATAALSSRSCRWALDNRTRHVRRPSSARLTLEEQSFPNIHVNVWGSRCGRRLSTTDVVRYLVNVSLESSLHTFPATALASLVPLASMVKTILCTLCLLGQEP